MPANERCLSGLEHVISNHPGRVIIWILLFAILAVAAVLGIYFWNFHGQLSPKDETWGTFGDFVGGALNPILSFLALTGLLVTILLQSHEIRQSQIEVAKQAKNLQEQLIETRKATALDGILRVIDRLQDEKVRNAREVLYRVSLDQKKPYEDWAEDEKKDAEIPCHHFDVVGMLTRLDLLPSEFLDSWSSTIKKSWEAAKPLIDARRARDGDAFWKDFEYLYNCACEYEIKHSHAKNIEATDGLPKLTTHQA